MRLTLNITETDMKLIDSLRRPFYSRSDVVRDAIKKFCEGVKLKPVEVVETEIKAIAPVPEPEPATNNPSLFVDGVCESCVKGAHGGCYDGVRGVCNCDMEKCVGWKEKRRAMVSAEQSGWQAGV